ncbi:MAG: phosphoribosylaminoimidazolesuccinocarboxamide synthase [Planctomycetes bacterium]|nr:phosphoribosylaminoimidazolesuccinocarboxamide synthase [Planctomycetota bacterium]
MSADIGKRLYQGKSKTIYEGPGVGTVVMEFTNTATAGNGAKRADIKDKGECNNAISAAAYRRLETVGVATHYLRRLDATRTLVRKVSIVPLEVIVRNVAAGSFAQRYGVAEGLAFSVPVYELCYKNDALGDPFLSESAALALGLAQPEELAKIAGLSETVNQRLVEYFSRARLRLIDFKLEFGRLGADLLLADEVSPDTCRLWDSETGERLDKDRFRRDWGDVAEMYREVARRVALAWPEYAKDPE